MSNLYAFGDSCTYGYGLPDVWHENVHDEYRCPTYNPYSSGASSYAWPNILAKKIDRQCYNFGTPGASNKEILWRFQHVLPDIKTDDMVVFLWSWFDRHCILREDFETTFNVSIGRTKNCNGKNIKKSAIYNDLFVDPHDMLVSNWTRIHYAHLACKSIGMSSYHMFGPNITHEYLLPPKFIDLNDMNIIYTNLHYIEDEFPKALDEDHPGIEAHEYISDLFYELIKTNK